MMALPSSKILKSISDDQRLYISKGALKRVPWKVRCLKRGRLMKSILSQITFNQWR